MKTKLWLAFIVAFSTLISCTKDEIKETEPLAQPEVVTFSIQSVVSKTSLRAAAPVVTGKDARYIVELWNSNKNSRIDRIVQLNNPSFTLILDRSISYNVAVWVDYVDDVDDATGTPSDYFYLTTDFQRIVLNSLDGDPDAFDGRVYQTSNLPARDAFTGIFSFAAGQTYPTTLQVKRPLARINLVATDAGLWKNRSEVNGATLTFRVTNPGYYTFNVLTQSCVATGLNIEFQNTIDASVYNTYPDNQSQTVLSGLYFANTNSADNGGNTKTFTLHWQIGTGTEGNITLSDVLFKRNYNTNFTGGTLFNPVSFTIDANSEYDEPDVDLGF
ncbi:MAG: hypothetical protein LBV43_08055 [Prevotella sp.]|jgi:hypothetical protein|nr:hypothetical protein [Prevotella sp.]